jgi:nickel transport protein
MMFKKNHERKIIPFLYLLLFVLLTTFSATTALAHKVTIFAWVEGDTVHTQSKFSGRKKAKGAPVTVFDTEGNRLLEGKTDENGEFSFKIPKKSGLKVVLHAAMAHAAEWTIPAEEIIGVPALKNSATSSNLKTRPETISGLTDVNTGGELLVSTSSGLTKQEIKDLIEESLDKKLAPAINMLANLQDRGPGITEIFGGIGYIFGLVGIALYFANRRKKL